MKFHQKLIENGKGATQSPMSLQSASQVTQDYGNRYLMPKFRCKHATNKIRQFAPKAIARTVCKPLRLLYVLLEAGVKGGGGTVLFLIGELLLTEKNMNLAVFNLFWATFVRRWAIF